jgi:hypothetical protein
MNMNNEKNFDENNDAQCKVCMYWFRAVELEQMSFSFGYCKRQPPSLAENPSELYQRLFGDVSKNIGVFPLISQTNWCGEFVLNPLSHYTERLSELDLLIDPFIWAVHFDSEVERLKLIELVENLSDSGVVSVGDWLSLGNDQPRLIPNFGLKSLLTLNRVCGIVIKRKKK